ncbi:ATP-binding protein [Actinomycetospora sp. TBRC 11914]|uniref:ATP-binding protein n=1 Tax=Actinomycetospora sp. TBRC 11914 TaxID=2729387 RepID=UPI00145EEE73|nr:ATP-binding protein [Actinomycetospora sp. TBRC 11914]NMO90654.1 hypothetical protein [Actinomycetospora sp. TBRC 11914]
MTVGEARAVAAPARPAPGGDRWWLVAFWVVFVAVSVLALVWLTVGALVTTPLNEPPGQAVVDYVASGVNLVVAVVLLRWGGSWSTRLLALAMVGSAGAFNLQAHSATMAVQEATGIGIGEAHQILLHGVAGASFAGALLLLPAEIAGTPVRRRAVPVVAGVVLFAAGLGTALLPHTVSCVVFFGFLVPVLGVAAIAPGVRRASTPEARARARLLTSVLVAAVGAATVLAVLTVVLVLLGRPGLTLDDPTARHSALGGEPTALLFWFARLTAAVIALAVLAARRARPAERWLRSGLAALVVVVALGGLAVLLAAVVETLSGSTVAGWVTAAVVVAVLWQPTAARTERLAERLLYGTRATPAGVLAEVAELTRRTAGDPGDLDRLPEAVAGALGARAVRLTTHREGMSDRTSRWRAPGSGVREPDASFPVRHEGVEVGTLAVDAEALAGGDERRRLVADVADGLGGVLAAHRLEIELERQLRAAVAHAEQIAVSRRRLVSEMDSERRGIERNLHDGAQHHLVSLRLTLGLVEHLTSAGQLEKAHERLELLLGQLDTAESVLAETATGVSSRTLRRLGPVETLRADLAEAQPPVTVEGEGVSRHDEAIETAVYFSTLEAVNNARKHAGGAPISVRITEGGGLLRAVVRDEGPGFTPEPGGRGPGRGMRNLAARLAAVSGRVDVQSAPGAGTTVRVEVPVPDAAGERRRPGMGRQERAIAVTGEAEPATGERRRPGTGREDRAIAATAAPEPAAPEPAPAPAPAPAPPPPVVAVRRIPAVVPELGPPRRPDGAVAAAAPPVLPPSGSALYDASVDLLRQVVVRTPSGHPAGGPLAALLARHAAPWRLGVAGPDPAAAAATARVLAAADPPGVVVDLSARAAEGPLPADEAVDALVLLAADDAGSRVPPWLAPVPTVDVHRGPDTPEGALRVVVADPTDAPGVERLVEVLAADCRPRAARVRARAVLDGIEALARGAGGDPWGRRVLFEVERVRTAGAQELAESELAEALRAGRTVLPAAHREPAVRLLGRDGTAPPARLGLAADAGPDEVDAAAREQRARWQRLAAHVAADRSVREAAEVLAASCEALISSPGRAAAR